MAAASAVLKPAIRCINCDRKAYYLYKKDEDKDIGGRKTLIRCKECWITTYCDESCQKEHWHLVHKYHCPYLSGKKVSEVHSEESCVECIAQKTTSKDELLDVNSPKTGCKFKEESNRMKRELEDHFGSQIAGEHPFPMGEIQGKIIATLMDEMMVHASKLCNAFIIKSMNAKVKKDTITDLFVILKSVLKWRVNLWEDILNCGNIISRETCYILGNVVELNKIVNELEDKGQLKENPWFQSLKFSITCIHQMMMSQRFHMEMNDSSSTMLSEKIEFHRKHMKNIDFIYENNLWSSFKMWPTKVANSLVLHVPNDIFCVACHADLSGLVVGNVNAWDTSGIFPSLFSFEVNNGTVTAVCSPVKNTGCTGQDYVTKLVSNVRYSAEEKEENFTLLKKTRNCHLCLKWSLSSHRCRECLSVQYCSKVCAMEDFSFHKTVCSTWAEDPARRLMASNEQRKVSKKIVKKIVDDDVNKK